MSSLATWLRQPSTVAGISTVFGTVTALLTHQISLAMAAPLLAGAAMSIALPDNSGARQEAADLTKDVVDRMVGKPGAGA
jgi:type IV secretory pathway VirB2 component (pilin)